MMKHMTPGDVGPDASAGDAMRTELEHSGTPPSSFAERPLPRTPKIASRRIPEELGQIVLVLQGGGALGAYQGGVYQALHEAGVEPDWVIGTSIGAINASLIAGNAPEDRLVRLREFWDRVRHEPWMGMLCAWPTPPPL